MHPPAFCSSRSAGTSLPLTLAPTMVLPTCKQTNGAVAGSGAGKYKRGRAGCQIAVDHGSNHRKTLSNGQYCIKPLAVRLDQ